MMAGSLDLQKNAIQWVHETSTPFSLPTDGYRNQLLCLTYNHRQHGMDSYLEPAPDSHAR